MYSYQPVDIIVTGRLSDHLILFGEDIVTTAEGLDPPSAVLLSRREYMQDGSTYMGGYLNNRNIVLTINIFRNINFWRKKIQTSLAVGEEVTLQVQVPGADIDWLIDGAVESVNVSHFADAKDAKQTIQVSLICHKPFFYKPKTFITKEGAIAPGSSEVSLRIDYPSKADGVFYIKIERTTGVGITPCPIRLFWRYAMLDQDATGEMTISYSTSQLTEEPIYICCGYAPSIYGVKEYGIYQGDDAINLTSGIGLGSEFPALKYDETIMALYFPSFQMANLKVSVIGEERFFGI